MNNHFTKELNQIVYIQLKYMKKCDLLINKYKNKLPNAIFKAEDDEYSDYIFELNVPKKVMVKYDIR